MRCLRGLPRPRIYHDKHCSGDMRYACDVCGERFFVHGHMKRHLYSHTGIKPHACRSLKTFEKYKKLFSSPPITGGSVERSLHLMAGE